MDPDPERSSRRLPRLATRRSGRHIAGRRATPGAAPGSVAYTGRHAPTPPRLRLIRYRHDGVEEREVDRDEAVALASEPHEEGVVWLDVTGLADGDLLSRLGRAVGLHPLWIEDVANVGQRPKHESDANALLIVLRTLLPGESPLAGGLEPEQVSIGLARGLVVTFQERPGDVFEGVRERIRSDGSRLRRSGADHLAYALVDAIVEEAFALLERYGDAIDGVEDQALRAPSPRHLQRIHELRMDALHLRRTVWPTRDLLAALLRDDTALLDPETRTYLRDVHDHAVQAVDAVETLRELLIGLQESTLSLLSLRMNEVMKVLTVVSTIFIPLTFLVGVYGMNFETMPELGWPWAYPALWLAMATLGFGLAVGFRRKGWL